MLLEFQEFPKISIINMKTQIKTRKSRNHSYDVEVSKTTFKKYELEFT